MQCVDDFFVSADYGLRWWTATVACQTLPSHKARRVGGIACHSVLNDC